MSAPTTNEKDRLPAKGDLVLTFPLDGLERQLFLIHSCETDDTTSGFDRLYGINLQSIIDFRDPATDGPEGFIEWFRITTNPQVALTGLEKTIIEPILTMADAIPTKVSEIRINDDDGLRLASPGAVRTHLLGHCPFPCTRGIVKCYYKFAENWPDILPAHGEAAKELRVPTTMNITASIVHADQEVTPDYYTGGLACPGCLGYELAKEHIVLQVEWSKIRRLKVCTETIKKLKQLEEKMDAFEEKLDDAQDLCGYFDNDEPSTGVMFDKEDSKTKAEALPVFDYEFFEAAKERVLEDKSCAICRFVEYERGAQITGLPCNHFFHRDCLDPWLKENDDCPLCRKKVAKAPPIKDDKMWPSLPTQQNGN